MTLSCAVLKVVAMVTIVALMPSQFVSTDAAIYDVGWSPNTDLQAWADSKTFYPNDSLVFKYTPEYNVLEVTQLAFMNCLTTNPVSEYNSGPTMIKLGEPGTRFFISGGPESCLIKLSIDVVSLPV
ncbi:early nodulin-like protein 3 [Pistacia vera]|uniref:early nodulin-like protein 3 n=1 Tax=Pistacia vera TaxID=55513 RepID=UPI0012636A9E|nr:early nodulin-like protein 3 [Pistacia vera]XP_031279636.1 early nodulin-like protein 3 [Pistacia vera]